MALDRSTIWPYRAGEPGEFFYSRYDHPAGVEAEKVLGELDGGHALLFSSGAAACTTAVLGLLSPGETIALAEGCYYGTSVLFRELERWGVGFVEFDQTGAPPEGVDLIWLEAPSNPFLTFPDMEAARAHPARVLVDATASTPILFRPLEHGADVVLHSATKYIGGHHDALAGVLTMRERDVYEPHQGAPGPHGPDCRTRHGLPGAARPEDAGGARPASVRERARPGSAPGRASRGRTRPLSRPR